MMRAFKNQNTNEMKQFIFEAKKPSSPHTMDSQVDLTEEEYKRRIYADKQLSELGISTSVFDANKDGHEDKDILEAIIIANRGEEIPEDLKVRIKNKNKEQLNQT